MAAITLDIGGNTRRLDRDIQKTVNRVYNINLKTKGDQPLGRITGKVNEFNKSLDASNARVIAFGASAGIIFGVERAFTALVSATIEVQKSLQDINVILNASQANLQKFGAELFNIARNTGQSFQEVAKAATEFSRQGLGIEETLKRTSEALILSRLSGLDAAKSVESLTAAVNSFASQAVTATEVVNKFATVDAAFAVSSADLADAIARVGSSAAQSGVSLNELIAIVTSAQQTTARGGAVIGNSFKTIFTRLQREKVVDLLESLGISGTDASGQVKSTIQLLQDLGKVYDTLGSQQQAYVAEQVGGVFQINILKAALADLGKEYSIYSSALNVAAGATDQAIRRNEELNKTYAAQINALQENARQLAAAGGERLLGPTIDRLVGGTNTLLEGFSESDGQGVGAVLGKGILDGIGQFIAGPGLALIGGVLLKLFRDLAKFATGSVQQLLGLNTAATQQRDLQQSINQILAKNPQLLELALKGEQGLNAAANSLLANLQKQTVELQKQAQVAQQISKAFIAQAGVRVAGGVPVVPTGKTPKAKSGGFIPNFSVQSELTGIKKSRDYTSSQKRKAAGDIRTANFPGIGPTVFNGQETIAKSTQVAEALGYPKGTKPKNPAEKYSILTPKMSEDLGVAAQGFVPNFASYSYRMKTFAGEGVKNPRAEKQFNKFFNKKSFSNVEQDDRINTVGFKIEQIPLTPKLQELYNTQPGSPAFTKQFEDYAIKKLGFINAGAPGSGNVKLYGGSSSAVDGYRIRNGFAEFLEVKGGGFETLAVANKFGRVLPENLARFTQSQLGMQYLNMLFKEGVPKEKDVVQLKNTLAVPQVSGARKGNFNRPFRIKDIEANRARNMSRSAGFIPNFAQGKNAIDLGDTRTSPALKGKVLSLIHPGISQGYSMTPATASYLGQQYRGLIPVAGINEQVLKGQLPDLDKNLGDLLVREANQFGQAIGGGNFLKSAQDLPNFGAAKGAVGVAFEGGLLTLLRQNLQKTAQNAGIDFRQNRITPKLRNLFHGAPGMYDAKYSPELVNDVMSKLLQEAKVGEVKKVKSGPGYKDYDEQRKSALNYIRSLPPSEQPRRGNALEAAIRKRIAEQARLKGMAAGFIPNFAPFKLMGDRKKEYEDFVLEPVRGGKLKDRLWDRNPTREQRLKRVQQSKENKAAFDKIKNLPITANALDNLKFYRDKRSDQYDSSGKMVLYKDRDGLLNSYEVRSHEYSGLESNAITVENGRVVLEDYSPNSSKKIPFNSEFKPLVSTMASALGMGVTTRSALTKQLSTSRVAAIRNSPLYKAEGFIPNFAAQQIAEVMALETAMSGEKAIFDTKPFPHVRNKSQPTFGSAMADHGGKNKALKDSLMGQKKAGLIRSSGFIPNFAIEDPDVQAADAGTAIAAITAQLSGLAFAFAFNKDELKQTFEEIIQKNKEQGRVTGELTKAQKAANTRLVAMGKITGEEAKARGEAGRYGPTAGQKIVGFAKANTFGLATAAPILGETIKNVVGQETPGARKTGAVASAAGQIGSFAATGALIAPGPVGAGIGAAVGAILTIPALIDEFTTSMPELTAAAKKASQDLTKFGDVGQRLLVASAELSKLMGEGGSQEAISKAQDVYAKALSELSDVDRDRLSKAARVGKLEEEYAKVLQEKVEETAGTERFVKLQALEEKKTLGVFAGGFDANLETRQGRANAEILSNSFKSLFTTKNALPQELKDQVKSGKITEQQAIQQNFQRQKEAGLPNLQNLQNEIQGLLDKGLQPGPFSSVFKGFQNDFGNILEGIIPDSKTKAEDINQLLKLADDDIGAFSNVLKVLIQALSEGPEALKKALDAAQLDAAANEKRTAALKKAGAAIDATINSIQKNISVQNLLRATLDNTAESFRSLSSDLKISQKFTQPAETLESLIGTTAAPAMALRAQSDTEIIRAQERTGLATAGLDLKNEIRNILGKPFQENLNKIISKLQSESGALKGSPGEIIAQSDIYRTEASTEQKKLTEVIQNTEGLMRDFINKQITQEKLLDGIRTELKTVGIEAERGKEASNEIEMAVANYGAKSVNEFIKAFSQRAKLANETKKAILQAQIDQATKVFGGFEGFMNRPNEEQNYIEKIDKDINRVAEMRSSAPFRNTNRASVKEQERQAPELGRSIANIYRELLTQSGGAFRDFLQTEADTITGVSGSEGRSGRAGAGAVGGFQDVVRAREEDIKNELKLAKERLKTPEVMGDPVLKRTLEGFINSIQNIPGGTRGAAEVQTMKEFGVGNQKRFEEIYGKFQSNAMERLKQISPELAASLESALSVSDDPLMAEAQLQSGLQSEIVGFLGPIQSALLQMAKLSGSGSIEAYTPKLNEEQKARAEEFKTENAKIEARAKEIQDSATPKDKITTIGPAPSPDYQKYQELNKPGQTFKSFEDMLTNWAKRDAFLKTGKVPDLEVYSPQDRKTQPEIQQAPFVQQEAALNNNTTAINTLNEGIRNLNTAMSEKQNAEPVNSTPGRAGIITGTTPQVSTTTNAPVTVVVNAEGGGDIANAVAAAIQKAIPDIVNQVRLARGEKIPPSLPRQIPREVRGS